MRKNLSLLLTLSLLYSLFFIPRIGFAVSINAKSCSKVDVQAAIDSASTGDTIIIPAGESDWNSAIGIPDGKKITLSGAGKTATIITCLLPGPYPTISLGKSGSRLTGIKIVLPNGSAGYGVHVYGYGWRIDHCEFENKTTSSKMGVYARGLSTCPDPTGLIDNCTFKDTRVNIHGDASLTANSSWYKDYQLGSADFIFVEDCVFTRTIFGNCIDSQYGSNYVFRYNTVFNSSTEVHSSTGVDGSYRASRFWEIYGNIFNSNNGVYAPFRQRGGTGVVFNNKVSGNYVDPNILLDNVRTIDGQCSSYPCRDQIGSSRDLWLWESDNPYPAQLKEPAYAWGNTNVDNGQPVKFKVINGCNNIIVEGRDFYNVQKAGYTPYTYPHPLRDGTAIVRVLSPKNLKIAQ